MSKMDDEELLELLNRKESAASSYVWGQLGNERETALREYYRLPYGNEEEGWSSIVASDIQDTVQWILPSLLKTFTATDKAVSFEPSQEGDVEGAAQATDACNYVFYKQNNGFMVLHTAFTDALTVRNCAVMWRKEKKEDVSSVPFKGATAEMLAMLTQDGSEIQEASPAPMMGPDGTPLIDPMTNEPVIAFNGRLKRVEEKTIIKVEAFSPEDLLIEREWTSPLLQDCPYVARMMRVTTSDLKQMGFDVAPSELRGSAGSDYSGDSTSRLARISQDGTSTSGIGPSNEQSDDDSMAEGWLRMEWVLVDIDGDGIAERVNILRLHDKILKKEICSHVPIATFSPVPNSHRWDGMGVHDLVGDLQKLHTELLRQTLNNLYLTNNPRTKVLTDANWSPLANLDDLMDSRPGSILRQRDLNAIQEHVTPFAAAASMPMLEYVQGMRENRTGVSRTSQGMNPDSLNNTATGRQIDLSASQQRIELIARIAAEVLLKPIFTGILKLLTEGGMEKISLRLRDKFVELDPNEWRDSYDMTVNVGLGTGDQVIQAGALQMILQNQVQALQMGLAKPENIYHTLSKQVENSGYKDVQKFFIDPSTSPPQPPQPPPPDPALLVEQMRQQAKAQEMQFLAQQEQQKMSVEDQQHQREMQRDMELARYQQEMQAQESRMTNQIEAERDIQKAQIQASLDAQKLQFDQWKAELDSSTKIAVAQISAQSKSGSLLSAEQAANDEVGGTMGGQPKLSDVMDSLNQIVTHITSPKVVERGADGRAVAINGRPIVRGQDGRISGIQ